ncbi:DUF4062 domain-containing protein [Hyphococcus sp. DH-69]|uniref:DUF4062 domain-containing protein n=1 Tax=Hyphococcus formosus TaxID=3143534 RepID=UPI00398A98FB
MDKRYQVFVSSTFEDLKIERQNVMHALLELDCIPSGMELFPAADEETWGVIKEVIDECDYYVLILAGRYGSGYTEKEYRYAVETGKPVIAFIHEDIGKLQGDKLEATDDGKEKLNKFRKLVEARMCKKWSSPDGLAAVVVQGINRLRKRNPAIGWVRGDMVTSQDAAKEILRLRHQVDELEGRLVKIRTQAPPDTDHLSQGEEDFEFAVVAKCYLGGSLRRVNYKFTVEYTWNAIFSAVAPLLINEATDEQLSDAINSMIELDKYNYFVERVAKVEKVKSAVLNEAETLDHDFQTIKVQLRALGLITENQKARSVKDTATYWTLTPYGNEVMVRLRAIERPSDLLSNSASQNSDSVMRNLADSVEVICDDEDNGACEGDK